MVIEKRFLPGEFETALYGLLVPLGVLVGAFRGLIVVVPVIAELTVEAGLLALFVQHYQRSNAEKLRNYFSTPLYAAIRRYPFFTQKTLSTYLKTYT